MTSNIINNLLETLPIQDEERIKNFLPQDILNTIGDFLPAFVDKLHSNFFWKKCKYDYSEENNSGIYIHAKNNHKKLNKVQKQTLKFIKNNPNTTMKKISEHCEKSQNYIMDVCFKLIDRKRYPLTKILKILPNNFSLFETILVSANDEIVKLFLDNKIKFIQIAPLLLKFIKLKEFNKYKEIQPKTIDEIVKLNNYVRLKINSMSV